MINYLRESNKKLEEAQNRFHTRNNVQVFVKDNLISHDNIRIDIRNVITTVERLVPFHLFMNVEFIYIGWLDEYEKRNINSFYEEGTLYLNNIQDSEEQMVEDIIHEIAHSLEEPYGMQLYADGRLQKEFIGKRKRLYYLMASDGYEIPLRSFLNTEFDEDFDDMLYKEIGYEKLSQYIAGLFIDAYSVTSIREYLAGGFQEFYTTERPTYLQKICPELYIKLKQLNSDQETLDI